MRAVPDKLRNDKAHYDKTQRTQHRPKYTGGTRAGADIAITRDQYA